MDTTLTQDLFDTVSTNGSFKTFSDAVERAGLSASLRGRGPFTIFAPTDAAFEQMLPGQLEALFQPENQDLLACLVNYHVITGRKLVGDMKSWVNVKTVNGQSAKFRMNLNQVSIDGANVTKADIPSSNGIVHGIDKVNMPPLAPRRSTTP